MHALFPYTGSCLGDKASIPLNGIARLQVTKKRKLRFHWCNGPLGGGVTKQSPALEMKLQAILTKLEKLDAIESQFKSYKKRLQEWIQEFSP